jgi:hypothetical protein
MKGFLVDKILRKMVLSYDLIKKQSYVERLRKEGEIQGFHRLLQFIEGDSNEVQKLKARINSDLMKSREQLSILKAEEKIFSKLDKSLEKNLLSLDILNELEESHSKFPKEIQKRVDTGKCGLKRPGKGFICEAKVIEGEKYCRRHLQQYNKVRYLELFGDEDAN